MIDALNYSGDGDDRAAMASHRCVFHNGKVDTSLRTVAP